jgi:hypothetical protein
MGRARELRSDRYISVISAALNQPRGSAQTLRFTRTVFSRSGARRWHRCCTVSACP